MDDSLQFYITYSTYMHKLIKLLSDNYMEYEQIYKNKNLQSLPKFSDKDGRLNIAGNTIKNIIMTYESMSGTSNYRGTNNKNFNRVSFQSRQNSELTNDIPKAIATILTSIPGKYVYSLFKAFDLLGKSDSVPDEVLEEIPDGV